MLFHLVLVANDIAGVRSRNSQELEFDIRNKFAAVDLWWRHFHCFFVFDLVILALGGNAPPSQARDLPVCIQVDIGCPVVSTARSQDLSLIHISEPTRLLSISY